MENGETTVVETEAQKKHREALDVAAATMTGDLRDAALMWIRQLQKPWAAMSEENQQDVIESIEKQAIMMTRKAVELIAAQAQESVVVVLQEFKVKGSKLELKLSTYCSEEYVGTLLKMKNVNSVLRLADVEPMHGEREKAKPDPQQLSIPGTDGEAPPASEEGEQVPAAEQAQAE